MRLVFVAYLAFEVEIELVERMQQAGDVAVRPLDFHSFLEQPGEHLRSTQVSGERQRCETIRIQMIPQFGRFEFS